MVCNILKTSASFFILRVPNTRQVRKARATAFPGTGNLDDMPNTNVTKHMATQLGIINE